MEKGFVARARVAIEAPVADVWNALVTPETIARYMFGTTVVSDWKEGGAILWRGDLPENHHTVTIELSPQPGGRTDVSLSQDNNATEDARTHSEANWRMMLDGLKRVIEERAQQGAHAE